MPRNIILDGAIVADSWQTVGAEGDIPASGDVIVTLADYHANAAVLSAREDRVGIEVLGETELDEIADIAAKLDLIAIHFPVFRDGRGYSLARLIRERLGFGGELRATGDVLRDQLFYLQRCGFNSFAIREDRDLEEALTGLQDFSVTYQADAQEKRPIYQRRS